MSTPLPTLSTARLRLRQLDANDTAALFAVYSDPVVMRYWSRPPQRELAEAAQLVADIDACRERGDLLQWGIERLDIGQVIGTCTLADINPRQGRAEVGYILGSAHWRQGYAREALARLLAHARTGMGLRRIEADVDPRNAPSLKVLERLGFTREGYLRERWVVAGETQDSVLLGLLLRDFVG